MIQRWRDSYVDIFPFVGLPVRNSALFQLSHATAFLKRPLCHALSKVVNPKAQYQMIHKFCE